MPAVSCARRGPEPTRAVVVAVTLMVIVGCAGVISTVTAAATATRGAMHDRTFRSFGVRLRYPAAWRAYTYPDDASSFSRLVVYLSNRRLHEPCVTHKTPHVVTKTCGTPLNRIAPRSILVSWAANSFPGWSFARAKGSPIRVDGHRAKLLLKHSTCGINAGVEMDVVIQRRAVDNWVFGQRLHPGTGTARFTGQFKTLLTTAHIVS